ncbi:MAG: prepilin-type N-terminal cleavage/methylation domain-containing protein [Fimbriimonadaceae bacterium]|nr:prepilin-type N-terminal cleavage/methylation domain-containing protein [Fimbriimonadaceae bacterium]
MRKAFTIIELLVVIAIIAILAAFIFPVFLTAKAAVHQMGVGRTGKQIYTATNIYQADNDDTYPIAMYFDGEKIMTWFGRQTTLYEYDPNQGILSAYMKGKIGYDPALIAEPWMGNKTGIGYNWGVIGSDMHEIGDYSDFPNCKGAATSSSLTNPSQTIVFATSAFYNVAWKPGGTGMKHQFNFFDPPEFWEGVPNVDFRHQGTVKVDTLNKKVTSTGNGIFIFADGSVRTYKEKNIDANWFWRTPLEETNQ